MDPPLSTMYVSAWRSACAPSLPRLATQRVLVGGRDRDRGIHHRLASRRERQRPRTAVSWIAALGDEARRPHVVDDAAHSLLRHFEFSGEARERVLARSQGAQHRPEGRAHGREPAFGELGVQMVDIAAEGEREQDPEVGPGLAGWDA